MTLADLTLIYDAFTRKLATWSETEQAEQHYQQAHWPHCPRCDQPSALTDSQGRALCACNKGGQQ